MRWPVWRPVRPVHLPGSCPHPPLTGAGCPSSPEGEADRSGGGRVTSSLQEDIARVLVTEYAGDLEGARELAQSAVTRSRTSGSTYWLSGFLAQLGFIETSARNWQAALQALREAAEIFASTKMVDLEQRPWGVDYADAALQIGATQDVEAAISVLRRQAASGRPEAAVAANRCQALLTAARGDVDNAVSELRRVVGRPGSECRFEAARSRSALGQVYRRAGYKGQASEVLKHRGWRLRGAGYTAMGGTSPRRSQPGGTTPKHEHAPQKPNAKSPNSLHQDAQIKRPLRNSSCRSRP